MGKRLYILSIFILMALLFAPFFVLADGMMIESDPYSDRWDYSGETNQQAIINYENGLEKMIISVGLDESNSEGVVWLFPVPSEPNKVVIDVVKELPQLRGEEISGKAKSVLLTTREYLMFTQIYTLSVFQLTSSFLAPSDSLSKGELSLGVSNSGESDVVVYEHLEKEGITSEIITAKTATGLYDYLKDKGLKVENGTIPILDQYIGKDFSFVASWITNINTNSAENALQKYFSQQTFENEDLVNKNIIDEEILGNLFNKHAELESMFSYLGGITSFRKVGQYRLTVTPEYMQWRGEFNQYLQANSNVREELLAAIAPEILPKTSFNKGIFVTFLTEDIYFPLLPTSVYGSKIVPATIKIIGHVSPKLFSDIKNYTEVGYYTGRFSPGDYSNTDTINLYKNFYQKFSSQTNSEIKYTKIEINAPSKVLTDDLWISSQAPLKTYYSSFIINNILIIGIILLFITSFITGVLVGLIVFKEARSKKGIIKWGLLGLFNCLTIIGLIFAIIFSKTKEGAKDMSPLISEVKSTAIRRIGFILFIFLCILVVPVIFFIAFFAVMMLIYPYNIYAFLFSAAIIAGILLIIILRKKRKNKEGNQNPPDAISQLKSEGYSSWTFLPKDRRKTAFVIFFSISYLIIAWGIIELIKITV